MKTTTDFTFFWGNQDPFSQWHKPATFAYKGITFSQAEQFMMFCKAMLFADENVVREIMLTNNPRIHKEMGRSIKNFDQRLWDYHCYNFVYVGNREKFLQNPKLLDALLETRGTELVEASPFDRVWGVGLSQDDPRIYHRDTWQGKNLLGEILTVLRDEIIAIGPENMNRDIEMWWD